MKRTKRGKLDPDQSSIVINLMSVMLSRGIKYPDAFLKRIGISSTSTTKLLRGEASQLNMKQLTRICLNLNCTPNDLFALRDMQLPPNHALNAIETLKPVSDMKTIEEFLGEKSVGEVKGMLRR